MFLDRLPTSIEQYEPLMKSWLALSPPEQRILYRWLARNDLYFLLRYLLNRKDMENPWLFARTREIQNQPDGHLDLWAREHRKTTAITVGKTIQDVLSSHGDDPDEKWAGREVTVGIFSHTRPQAKSFLRMIKNEFERNDALKSLFPDVLYANPWKESSKWSEDDGVCVKRKTNPGESTIEAWGLVDGQPIGKHFYLLVYDDIVTKESVNTPEMITKTNEALQLSFALGSEGGAKRFIGTRYHYNDSYSHILSQGIAKERRYAATATGEIGDEGVYLSKERLADKLKEMGMAVFASQMLLNPLAGSVQAFRREWIRHYRTISRKGLNVYICVDPASGKGRKNDYTSIWVLGLGQDDNIYALDIIRDRLSLTERADRVMNLHRTWKPLQVRYEQYGLQADIEHIRDLQERENYRFEVKEVGGKTKKEQRIERMIPFFERHRVYLPQSLNVTTADGKVTDMVRTFIEEEYAAFPVSKHDDMLDALSRIAEPDLKLVWPAKQNWQAPVMTPWSPSDAQAGM